jgi:class 3 adenylate cyclase
MKWVDLITKGLARLVYNVRQHPTGIGASNYPLRIFGYFMATLVLLGYCVDFGFQPLMVYLMAYFLICPHLMYLIYRFSNSNDKLELLWLWMDTLGAGVAMVLIEFSIQPSVALGIMTSAGNIGVRGMRQFLYGLGAIVVGILGTGLFLPIRFNHSHGFYVDLATGFFVTIYTLFFSYTAYRGAVLQRKLHRELEKEKHHSDELLLNILPEELVNELKDKGITQTRLHDEVTIMFTDFKDFTRISELLNPTDLVREIDYCFRNFDRIISQYPSIEKIKTIGDAYLCVGGLPSSHPGHATEIVSAALEIRDFIREREQELQQLGREAFQVRIGIHSGPVVAGVVGSTKFAYDIWGDTVNTAARLESSSEPGHVNISEATYQRIKVHFDCFYRGKISAKNKPEMSMYYVESAYSIPNLTLV